MAKYECTLTGDFGALLGLVENGILRGSLSASLEEGSDYRFGDVSCAIRVFERYSMVGSNRVSLSVTLVSHDRELFLSAITSGGSQAVFFKMNTLGEAAFLDRLVEIVEKYKASQP